MKSNKKWTITFVVLSVVVLCGLGSITAVIDPYFHYHKPLDELQYPIEDQRYQNDGIAKHFDYTAVVTGTSMTENFKTSQVDELFDVDSIKVTFSGGSFKEINDVVNTAIEHNPNIEVVIRGLDHGKIMDNKDMMAYSPESYPTYLYDDIWYNDVKYIFNKATFFKSTLKVLSYTKEGKETTSFDEYSRWDHKYTFAKESVDAVYDRPGKSDTVLAFTEEDRDTVYGNVQQNIIALAEQNPEIDFYMFFTPYSIYYWDRLNQQGRLERQLEAEKYAIELLLPYENIHLYSFFTEYEMVCDLDNYKDVIHHNAEINEQMLVWMKDGEHLLTEDNYEEYCSQMYDFYTTYDYDALFATEDQEAAE